MRRRDLLMFAGTLATGGYGAAIAQSPKMFRIGRLGGGGADAIATEQVLRFTRRLAELGFVEGRDFVLEIRGHRGRIERVPELAAELIQLQPDVIVASGPEAVLKAVSSATSSIP